MSPPKLSCIVSGESDFLCWSRMDAWGSCKLAAVFLSLAASRKAGGSSPFGGRASVNLSQPLQNQQLLFAQQPATAANSPVAVRGLTHQLLPDQDSFMPSGSLPVRIQPRLWQNLLFPLFCLHKTRCISCLGVRDVTNAGILTCMQSSPGCYIHQHSDHKIRGLLSGIFIPQFSLESLTDHQAMVVPLMIPLL